MFSFKKLLQQCEENKITSIRIKDFLSSEKNNEAKFKLKRILKGHTNTINNLCYSPNGKYIISASNYVIIWDARNAYLVEVLNGSLKKPDVIYSHVVCSNCGRFIAAGRSDGVIDLWNIGTHKLIKTLKSKHFDGYAVTCITFSPNNKFIAAGYDGTGSVLFWDINKGTFFNQIQMGSDAINICFSSDSEFAAIVDTNSNIGLYNHSSEAKIKTIYESNLYNDDTICCSSNYNNSDRCWRVVTGHKFCKHHKSGVIKTWFFSIESDGYTSSNDFKTNYSSVGNICLGSRYKYLIASGDNNIIKIWDILGELLTTLKGNMGRVYCTCFSPDNKTLVSGSEDKTIRIWQDISHLLCSYEIQSLFITLITNKSVTSLDLSDMFFQKEDIKELSELIKTNKHITSINLSNVEISSDASLLDLYDAIYANKTLTHLELGNYKDSYILEDPIKRNKKLLQIKQITTRSKTTQTRKILPPKRPAIPKPKRRLPPTLPSKQLRTFIPKSSTPQQIQQILNTLKTNPYVNSLDLRDIQLSKPNIATLCGVLLANKNIIFVDLSNTNIGNDEAQMIAKILPSYIGLKHLDLSKNNLTNAQTRSLYNTCKQLFWDKDKDLTLDLRGNRRTCNFDELQVGDLLLKYNDGSASNEAVMFGNRIHSFLYGKEKYIDISHAAIYTGNDTIIESTSAGIIKTNLVENNRKYDIFRYTPNQQIGKFAADIAFSLHQAYINEQKERGFFESFWYTKSGGYNWKVLLTSFVKTSKLDPTLIKNVAENLDLHLQGKRFYCSELVVFVYSLAAQLSKQQSLTSVFPIEVGHKNILPVILYHVIKRDKNWHCIGEILPRTLYLARSPNFGPNYCRRWGKKKMVTLIPTIPSNIDIPEEFLCPITREIMLDPVTIGSGVNYEKQAIYRWLIENNTCPRNRTVLPNKIIKPNAKLKKDIKNWLAKIKQPQIKQAPVNINQGRAIQLENQADEHYINGKIHLQNGKQELARKEFMIAKIQYKKLQNIFKIDCSKRIEKIKLKLNGLQNK